MRISKPCSEDWDAMHGDARRRFCESCGKHVHDFSHVTAEEARPLMRRGTCVRIRAATLGVALLASAPALGSPAVSDAPEERSALERVVERVRAWLAPEVAVPDPPPAMEVMGLLLDDGMDWPSEEPPLLPLPPPPPPPVER